MQPSSTPMLYGVYQNDNRCRQPQTWKMMGSESDKVVRLSGAPLPQPGEANEKLVKMLEDIMEMAKSGEIVGAGVAMLHADRLGSYEVSTPHVPYSMIGAASVMLDGLKAPHRDG